ncbi:MAG TPA: HAD-IIIA family hydrolase [Phormidium sp.]
MLLILDKDGTLVTAKPDSGTDFPGLNNQILMPGVKEILVQNKVMGDEIFVASNQGGVHFGHKTIEQAVQEFQELLELLPCIDACFFCPDMNGDLLWRVDTTGARVICSDRMTRDSLKIESCRKSGSGMHEYIINHECGGKYSKNQVLYVGDRKEDQDSAARAGVKFLWVTEWLELKA